MTSQAQTEIEIRHFHLFCGLGGGARGFNRGRAEVGNMRAKFRCIGGIDSDPAAAQDFARLTGTRATCRDLFDREQYVAFHGCEPAADWMEAGPDDIRRAAGNERPHIIFLSAPCKGFSGLLSEQKSKSEKYQALNRLTLRGIWLALEAWPDNPPELIIFENVPRIATRGRQLLDRIGAMLRAYGYAVAETTHDCGEIGGLAQSRKRFLLVARHVAKVPAFLYEPPKRPLRAVGEILGRMPLPGDPAGGPMHNVPRLKWKTWVRLAFVEAGSDWRSLNRLRVVDGKLADYLLVPDHRNDFLGVNAWADPSGTITGDARPHKGKFAVADPRFEGHLKFQQYGVKRWTDSSIAVTGQCAPGQGPISIADPRVEGVIRSSTYGVNTWDRHVGTIQGEPYPSNGAFAVADPRPSGPPKFSNEYRIVKWDQSCQAVTSAHGTGNCIADPRPPAPPADRNLYGKYPVADWKDNAGAVIGGDDAGAYAVADPRCMDREKGDNYLTGGHYGVVPWENPAYSVSGAACHDNGPWSVADPRIPEANDNLICVIRSLDNTWHRPFTTLELAALQSLVDPDELFALEGTSDGSKRERIGNAVPPQAAQAIANLMGETILRSMAGESFALSAMPVWVQPVAIALSVKTPLGDAL